MRSKIWTILLLSFLLPTFTAGQSAPKIINYFAVGQGSLTGNGQVRDGWESSLFLTNTQPTAATLAVKAYDGTGKLLVISRRENGALANKSEFAIELPGDGSAILDFVNDGALKVGHIEVGGDRVAQVNVSLVFKFYQTGKTVSFAGVLPGRETKAFSYPHTVLNNENTGLAVFNPGEQSVTLTAAAYDAQGNIQLLGGIRELNIPPGGIVALFTTEIFPNLFSPENFPLAKIVVTASGPVVPLVLLTKSNPDGGLLISTLALG